MNPPAVPSAKVLLLAYVLKSFALTSVQSSGVKDPLFLSHIIATIELVKITLTTDKVMLFTGIVLSIGFFTYTIAEMNNLFSLGLITELVILFAFLADLLVASAMISLLHPKKQKKSNTKI